MACTRGARTALCILRNLSCVEDRSPSTSQISYNDTTEAVLWGYFSDTLHEAVAEAQEVRSLEGKSCCSVPDTP